MLPAVRACALEMLRIGGAVRRGRLRTSEETVMRARVTDRHLVAFLVAPFAATLMWVVTAFALLAFVDGVRAAWRDVPTLLIGGAAVGLPMAGAAVLLVAAPLYAMLEGFGRLSRTTTLAGGAAVGVVFPPLLTRLVDDVPLLSPVTGGVVGLGTAVLWWLVAGRPGARRAPRRRSERSPTGRAPAATFAAYARRRPR